MKQILLFLTMLFVSSPIFSQSTEKSTMSLDEIFARRRSVRSYDAERKVSRAQIEEIITAAMEAPSWGNVQASRYYVVTGKDKLRELKEKGLDRGNQISAEQAPALVVTTFKRDQSGFFGGQQSNELGNEWGTYDLGLHNAYFMLKATERGLDTVVFGLRDADAIRKMLSIPDDEIIVAVIALGYRAEEPHQPTHKKLEEIMTVFE